MATTFVVEDGTGLATANSYISVANADVYEENHGNSSTWAGLTEPQKEEKLRLATQGIDLEYTNSWMGTAKLSTQALDWPRSDIADPIDGYAVDEDSVPQRIQDATAELALELARGKSIHVSQSDSAAIRRERVKLDVLEVDTEYLGAKQGTAVASFPRVERLVSRYITGDTGTIFRG